MLNFHGVTIEVVVDLQVSVGKQTRKNNMLNCGKENPPNAKYLERGRSSEKIFDFIG